MPVYLIRAGDTDMVKIGWARDVHRRLANLQGGHYEPLTLLRVIEGTRDTESYLHVHFHDQWVRNEWFRFVPEMLTLSRVKKIRRSLSPERVAAMSVAMIESWKSGRSRETYNAQKINGASLFYDSAHEELSAPHALSTP